MRVIVCADVRLTQLKAAAAINPFIVSSWRVVFDFTPIMHPLRSSGRALHDTLDHHSSDAREHGLGRRG